MKPKTPDLKNILTKTLLNSNKPINRLYQLEENISSMSRIPQQKLNSLNPEIAPSPIRANPKANRGLPYISSAPKAITCVQPSNNALSPYERGSQDIVGIGGASKAMGIKPTQVINDHSSIPSKSTSNSVVDYIGKDGNVNARVYYNMEGEIVKQINPNNHNNPSKHPFGKNGEHAHDLIWKDGKIINRTSRELTADEIVENSNILK